MTSMRGSDDEAVRADRDLFVALHPRLRRIAAVAAPFDLDPDDLLQEALARTLRHHCLTDLEHAEAYLRRAIVNLAANHNRSRGRERRALERVASSGAGSTVDPYPSDLSLLDALPAEDRVAVYLADVERLAMSDVADALGLTAVAARARLSRARRRLREVLAADASPASRGGAR